METKSIETVIKSDLENLPSGIRFFQEKSKDSINQITQSIIKHFPTSIIIKTHALREYGKNAILLEIEKQLSSIKREITPNLTMQLKSRSNTSQAEILGDILTPPFYVKFFTVTLHDFFSQTGDDQKIVLCLEVNDKKFATEFLNYLQPLIDNLPKNFFLFIIIQNNNSRKSLLHYKIDPNFYWENPLYLGADLHFLSQNSQSSLIEFLTKSEISLLLRLWGLSDIALSIGELGVKSLSKYSQQEAILLLNGKEFKFIINNRDVNEAEFKLYRELAFHYAYINNIEKSDYCKSKALNAIVKSKISNTLKTRYSGLIWGDRAQLEKNRSNLSGAIKSLLIQKTIYETEKDQFIKELSITSHNLGVSYRSNRNYKEALIELNYSLALENQENKTNKDLSTVLELGRTYVDLEDYKSALVHFKQISEVITENQDASQLYIKGTALAYIASLSKEMGDKNNLILAAEKAIQIFSELGAIEDAKKMQEILSS